MFYFAYILLHSARHYDLNLSLKYKSSVCWFLFFNLLSFVLLLITHIVSVFLSKTHTHTRARRKILQIGHGSTNFISGAQFFNIFVCCVWFQGCARLHHFSFLHLCPLLFCVCFRFYLFSVRILAFLQIARVILFVCCFLYLLLSHFV